MLAEPGALISFAGPRVVQQTTREKLPDDFGLAESNFRFGHLDAIVPRPELRPTAGPAAEALRCRRVKHELRLRERLSRLRNMPLLRGASSRASSTGCSGSSTGSARSRRDEEIWRSVELARHQDRPYTLDYVERLLDDLVELHGDRARGRRRARSSPGSARFDGRTVALVGHQKGRDIKERTKRNFGMAYPEGYRKAMRVMELADRHGFPVLTLVDTPGRLPGRRRRAARPGRRDRPLAGGDGAARPSRPSPASSARAAPAARSRSRSPTAC